MGLIDPSLVIETDQVSADFEKMVGQRVHDLITDPELFGVYRHFGGELFRRSSVYHGLHKFLRQCNVKGKRAFEIGSWNGLTAVVLARFFGHVTSVDIAHNPVKHDVVRFLGLEDRITFVDIESNAEKPLVWANCGPFSFAYMDGDHANDTAADWELVKGCGRVLFHECWPFQPPVWELVESLPQEQVTRGGVGLALWEGL